MPGNWSIILSTGPSDAVAGVPLAMRVHSRARRLRLRFDEKRGGLMLTVPPRTSRRTALAWAREQADWVALQLARRPPSSPIAAGAVIPFEGRQVRLEWREGASRIVAVGDGTLGCGGPRESFGSRIQTWLLRRARDTLSTETAFVAARAGVTVRAVSIGDADTRWGSCSASGTIRYNWRLILMPPAALRFVVAHEVAHRLHMNHGAAFKAAEARLYEGDVAHARLLLRDFGPLVRRVGRVG